MKLITLIMLLFGATVSAQEFTTPSPVPAVQKTAVVDGKKYYITKDKNNKFVFIQHQEATTGFAVKPIIITIVPGNDQN